MTRSKYTSRARFVPLFGLLGISLLVCGCVARGPLVIARCYNHCAPALTNRITLSTHLHTRLEDELLACDVAAELARRGALVVDSADAEFTLGCWREVNWKTFRTMMPARADVQRLYTLQVNGAWPNYIPRDAQVITSVPMEKHVATQGIRMRLYYTKPGQPGGPLTAWEGYIESGYEFDPAQQPVLVGELLDYFGKEFTGNIKLPK